MIKDWTKYEVKFERRFDGSNVPLKPWPQKFYVSNYFLDTDVFELRPLTVTGIIKGIGKNLISMNFWRFLRLLRLAGFLCTQPGERFSVKHWRWDFWNTPKLKCQ